MVDVDPPMEKSLTSRMSPSMCWPVKGLPLDVGEVVLTPKVGSCKNQKPAVQSPLWSKRVMPGYRRMWPLLPWVEAEAKSFWLTSLACGLESGGRQGPL